MPRIARRLTGVALIAAIPLTAVAAENQGWSLEDISKWQPSVSAALDDALSQARSQLQHAQGETRGEADDRSQEGGRSDARGRSTTALPSVTGTRIGTKTGVVMIATRMGDGGGAGTGIVWKSDGTIISNYHVVAGSSTVVVSDSDGRHHEASVIGFDQTHDIAVLRTNAAMEPSRFDTTPETGEAVSAVGQGGGLGALYKADGKVVAQGQSITATDESGMSGEKLSGLIRTDAPIVAGYSGGPLFDADGEVIGIDTAASGTMPISGFAIPTSTMLSIASDILAGKKTATNHIGSRAALGVQIVAGGTGGVTVQRVLTDGAVARTGIGEGDIITALDGVSVHSSDDLTSALNRHAPGDSVSLTWLSADGGHSAKVKLGTAMSN